MPVRVVDTAGLREAADRVEQEGIRRAREAMARADLVLLVEDGGATAAATSSAGLPANIPVLRVRNKTDLLGLPAGPETAPDGAERLRLSARTGEGIELLRERLRSFAGYGAGEGGSLAARRRHLEALDRATAATSRAVALSRSGHAPELAAEELRLAQDALGEITGRVTTEDLLGRIFSDFCIGK
jgi:tRNA modification GTPase